MLMVLIARRSLRTNGSLGRSRDDALRVAGWEHHRCYLHDAIIVAIFVMAVGNLRPCHHVHTYLHDDSIVAIFMMAVGNLRPSSSVSYDILPNTIERGGSSQCLWNTLGFPMCFKLPLRRGCFIQTTGASVLLRDSALT